MLSSDQILALESKVRTGADFPAYVKELKALGVSHCDAFTEDSRRTYYSSDGLALHQAPIYAPLLIADSASAEKLRHALVIHQQGQTDYLSFCRQAAEAGIHHWTTNAIKGLVIYFDKQGNEVLSEIVPGF